MLNNLFVIMAEKQFVGEYWEARIFCIGGKRYGCTHGYCHDCFWKKVKETDELEQGNTSMRRKSSRINS